MATPVECELLPSAVSPVEADVIAKADAGASLYWAIYFANREDVLKIMECDSVARAFGRAQDAFGPRGARA